MNLPSADDLFRPTEGQPDDGGNKRSVRAVPDPAPSAEPAASMSTRPSGRVKHDEKVTVYVTSQELLDIEHARLDLRSKHGLAVDRGRLVREAVSLVLAELEAQGAESALVHRLREE
ncbi:hypothetical protein [Nocardioides sp.]|uniref:hypothetical protein n=1 Tax=Nocardioides sp. TaxID=35761 RepID=UPI003566D592